MPTDSGFRRDLFEIENARNLTRDEIVATFVPTRAFWRIMSAKNHIVLGARGSGKTVLAKMLSHDHLSRWDDERAQNIIAAKAFLGIYVPTSVEWVGGLKNKPWHTEAEQESFFQWRLNLAACASFLITLRSCVEAYCGDTGEQARIEEQLARALSQDWSEGLSHFDTIRGLQSHLEAIEHSKQQQLVRLRATGSLRAGEEPSGLRFDAPLFSPLKRALSLTAEILKLPEDASWLLCLDEAEFLDPIHHRILNSYLRSATGNLKFKITTMPYHHHTLDTNMGQPLSVGDDFEYVYIDSDPIAESTASRTVETFANTLFKKRAMASGTKYQGLTLGKLLGRSPLLDATREDWGEGSTNMALLEKHATAQTVVRAQRLREASPAAFMDQMGRKLHGALLLREAVASQGGRAELDVYSGANMVVRCGDANPRRLIRLFNSLLLEEGGRWRSGRSIRSIPPKTQTRVLLRFSASTLSRVQSEPTHGPALHELLVAIGTFMRESIHLERLTTDQVSSVIVDRDVTPETWKLVETAVGLGLLFPNISAHNPDQMPVSVGTFHLAYVLAPHFRLLPRRGKARKLAWILSYSAHDAAERRILREQQADLFDYRDRDA